MTQPLDIFLDSIGSHETRRQYRRKLEMFFEAIGLEGSLYEQTKTFVQKAKSDKDWAFDCIVRFIAYQKSRCDNKEITAGKSK